MFSFEKITQTIKATGKDDAAVDRGLKRIKDQKPLVAALLRARQGESVDEELIERHIAVNVPSLLVYRANYRRWFEAMPIYYHRTESEMDAMFGACKEGDRIWFDFALSFTVQKPDGRLVMIDRRGRVSPPSPYSPAVKRADV